MDANAIRAEVRDVRGAGGAAIRRLRVGADTLRLAGLEVDLATVLDRRFGAFLEPCEPGETTGGDYHLEVVRSRRRHWLRQGEPGELYRLEALGSPANRVVLSYHFALCRMPDDDLDEFTGRRWRVALAEDPPEPPGRIMDNVARFLTARAAIDRGGFAMHGAGVVRHGRAHVFAGPSRSGKSTAVRLSGPDCSLGDDFAVVIPGGGEWCVPALPFDNLERIDHEPPRGLIPLSTVWRLFQAERHAVERPDGLSAVTSLMGCVAFPWLLPEAADLLLSRVTKIVSDGRFGHLHFRPDPGFWTLLV